MSRVATGGRTFDPNEGQIYFLAANIAFLVSVSDLHPFILVAAPGVSVDAHRPVVHDLLDKRVKVLIDSGIYELSMQHSRKWKMTMDATLSLPPDQVDGFPDLLAHYKRVIAEFGDKSWGYIELDQGGAANKKKTRAMLEADGLRPIPVYHPIVDGWDYFDELCDGYDRICIGNLVHASAEIRLRILATIHKRTRGKQPVWIHALGVTPDEVSISMPTNSADSSTWLMPTRFGGGMKDRAMLKPLSVLGVDGKYVIDSDADSDTGIRKAERLSAAQSTFMQRNWRNATAAYRGIGASPWG